MNPVLQTENLTKRFGSLVAVNNLSLEVDEGEVFGFLGPNGAGKTTSIQMMCGLLRPDSGKVLIRGKPIHDSDKQIKSRVGMCPQEIILWKNLTCLEQLEFVGKMYGLSGQEARKSGTRLLAELDLEEKTHKLGRTLSGGMQRRLNLALALVHDPEIVVLDEPEAGLDPQSRVKVREYIQSLAHKKTVILTTHNMDEAERVADRVAIIDHGEILVVDTPDALKQQLGKGDVIEIELLSPGNLSQIHAGFGEISPDLKLDLVGNHLQVRALHAVGRLAEILELLKSADLKPGEVKIRENSLEDVFIQLTGRRLRE